MPNIHDAFPSNYLKAADLQQRTITVTIEKVAFEQVGREREQKAVIYFAGKTKGLVCNKTNAKKLIEISGSALTEDWTGLSVALYPTETEFGGETVDCIRIKAAPSQPRLKPAATVAPPVVARSNGGAIPTDEIPF